MARSIVFTVYAILFLKGVEYMQTKRAEEIIKSLEEIEVRYQNSAVWLENVNKEKNTVYVKMLDEGNFMEVPANQLQETVK